MQAGDQGDLRRPGRGRVHRPPRARHARAPGRLPGRVAARLAQPVPLGAGAGRARRARLRHPRRREAAGGGRPGPPPDRQEPGLAARGRSRSRSCARSSPRCRSPRRAAPRRDRPRPSRLTSRRWAASATSSGFVFLGTALVVAAFSTGHRLPLLPRLPARRRSCSARGSTRGAGLRERPCRLPRPEPARAGRRGAAGVYRVENQTGWRKPWVELWNESTLPAQPARAASSASPARGSRQWLAKVTLPRRGQLSARRAARADRRPVRPVHAARWSVGQPTWRRRLPEGRRRCRTGACRRRRSTAPTPSRRRFEAATPLVSSVRPYVHGDAINRIHWLSQRRATASCT